jgi:diguanylate cyclase (GGDEF)-like protein
LEVSGKPDWPDRALGNIPQSILEQGMEAPNPKILIVDDSEDDAFLLSSQIRRIEEKCEFRRVDSAEGMRTALAQQSWDLVISDHSMPGFDSVEALRILRDSDKETPFVIYSGHLAQEVGISAMQNGAHDFVYKNDPERMLPVIKRELEHAKLRRDKTEAENSISKIANYDELTGLANRNLFCEQLDRRLKRTDATPPAGALLYIDLDRFMRINDSFGYPTGDGLMRQVAARLQACMSRSDLVARMGQDEFALYASNVTDTTAVVALAERIMQRFAPAFVQNAQEFFITVSIGISLSPQHGGDAQTLLKNAESAMFAVKKQGRNQFQVYQTELNHSSSQRLRLENDLRHAIARKQLFLAYQPIIDMKTRRIVSAEALIRWRHPELGIVPPDSFIPLADETGLIHPIGEWVVREACTQLRQWQDLGYDSLSVAVNVSAAQFKQDGLAAHIEQILRDTGVSAHHLELEITETVAMQSADAAIQTLRRFKSMGISISIDDFGTGYSSLSYLKRFPIDTLKIDRSFVRDISVDSDDAAIVQAIASLGRTLKLRIIAEGVETREQFEYLSAQGCDRMQGYYFSKPIEPADFLALLERHPKQVSSSPKVVNMHDWAAIGGIA